MHLHTRLTELLLFVACFALLFYKRKWSVWSTFLRWSFVISRILLRLRCCLCILCTMLVVAFAYLSIPFSLMPVVGLPGTSSIFMLEYNNNCLFDIFRCLQPFCKQQHLFVRSVKRRSSNYDCSFYTMRLHTRLTELLLFVACFSLLFYRRKWSVSWRFLKCGFALSNYVNLIGYTRLNYFPILRLILLSKVSSNFNSVSVMLLGGLIQFVFALLQ